MFWNPIIGMIRNERANTFHPVVFEENPLPGPPGDEKPVRHKSKMHHTGGFPSRDEALADIESNLKPRVPNAEMALHPDDDISWDGEGVPATVAFFSKTHEGFRRAT